MKTLQVIALALLLTTPLSAQDSRLPDFLKPGPVKSRAEIQALDRSFSAQLAESRLLLYRLTGEQDTAGKTLEVRIDLKGTNLVTETLRLEGTGEKAPVYELLARQPDVLEQLFKMAESRGDVLRVSVLLDGRMIQKLSFNELVRASQQIRREAFRPQAAASEVRSLAVPPARPAPAATTAVQKVTGEKAYSCEGQCYQNYEWCLENVCLPQGMFYCEECDQEYSYCMSSCPPPPCTDPKSVTEFNTTQLFSWGSTGYWQCFEDIFENDFQDGEWYSEFQYTYKVTRIRRTEYCNGTHSDQVISISYPSFYCYNPTFLMCYYPFTWAYNQC